jgi:hypothetical protein
MKYIVGAYATSPAATSWDAAAETAYFDGLKRIPSLRGLEVPFNGKLHAFDEAWLLAHVDPAWDFVVTCIPGTMQTLQKDAEFGLASATERGRRAALDFAEAARQSVIRLNRHLGRKAVIAVELHSAPSLGKSGIASSTAQFARSLAEIAGWDWQGARLAIEHCDAFQPGRQAIKGFLELDAEIDAVKEANAKGGSPVGFAVNWGRSVLETRAAGRAIDHIARLREAGLLSGLIFSGCGGADGPYGVWQDTHMPHAPAPGIEFAAEGSALTEAEIGKSLRAAKVDSLAFLGVKLGARPASLSIEARVGLSRDLLKLIDRQLTARA